MNKILCIVGPTGTGKTARAINEAAKTPSIIVSVDSRQVYRGMDIVTGKDHPQGTTIYGIDIVDPDQNCSVSVWYDSVLPIIQNSDPNLQIIVVGGTGLYVKALTEGIETMQVPINQSLRDELATLSVQELQSRLSALDDTKYQSMNHSDVLNSRRLTRAIEVFTFRTSHPERAVASRTGHIGSSMIGLKYFDDSNHRSKIRARVMDRINNGAIAETKSLIKKYGKNLQSLSAIGYKSIIAFIENKLSKEEMIDEWVLGELRYAKRQMTWFRKQEIVWYDIDAYGITKD